VNTSLDSGTAFLDNTVVPGQTYDYATTAVNSSGQESAYSNQVEIAVP
jgi:fibronectin type 3 domain-containing protein